MSNLETKLRSLEMDHLEQASSSELKEAVEAAVSAPPPPETDPKEALRRESRYTFRFEYTGTNGKLWAGTFTSVIPTVKVRQMIGVLRAQMAGGVPYGSLDPYVDNLNFVIAHLTFMLDDKSPDFPEWAKDLRAVEDPEVIFELWNGEVQPHEATFLGRS